VTLDERTFEFGAGDVATFGKGVKSHFRIESTVREVFVESGVE
jgi:uncharacterized cupin superfamily protein